MESIRKGLRAHQQDEELTSFGQIWLNGFTGYNQSWDWFDKTDYGTDWIKLIWLDDSIDRIKIINRNRLELVKPTESIESVRWIDSDWKKSIDQSDGILVGWNHRQDKSVRCHQLELKLIGWYQPYCDLIDWIESTGITDQMESSFVWIDWMKLSVGTDRSNHSNGTIERISWTNRLDEIIVSIGMINLLETFDW